MHLFEVRVAIERSVTAKEEVSDDADGPDVAVQTISCDETTFVQTLTQAFRGQSS